MGTKKSDCVAMFPESIEKVRKSMPKVGNLSRNTILYRSGSLKEYGFCMH